VKRFAVVVLLSLVASSLAAQAALAAPHGIVTTRLMRQTTAGPLASGVPTYPLTVIGEWYDGAPLSGSVGWGWLSPDLPVDSPLATLYYGNLVDAGLPAPAKVDFKAVTAHPGHDEVMADGPFRNHDLENPTASQPSLMDISRWGLDFSTLGSILLRPGRVQVDIANVPVKQYMDVYLSDPASGGANSIIASGGHGLTDCPPPDFTSGVATMDNGSDTDGAAACEWLSPGDTPLTATAGSITPGDVTMDWNTAVHSHILGPRCQLVQRAGGTLRFSLSNVPAGEQFSFCGGGAFGSTLPLSPVVTSASTKTPLVVSIGIPKQVQGGQDFYITAYRSDDPQSILAVGDRVSICSFSASRALVRRGTGVRLRGRLAANSQTATLLAAPAGTARPSTLAARGWKKVATLKLTNHGDYIGFLSAILHPRRSTSYVVRFADSWFVQVFTPVLTVPVKG
jgi:hypothetical protein